MDIKIKSSTEMYRNLDIDANKAGIEHKRILMTGMGDVLNAIQKGKISIDGDTFELSEEARTAMQEAFDKAMADQAKVNEMNAALLIEKSPDLYKIPVFFKYWGIKKLG